MGPSARPPQPFLRELVAAFRAQDPERALDARSEWDLLRPLIVGPPAERARGNGDPFEADPDVYLRIELYYSAIAHAVEQRSGVPCMLMLRMRHEGFGHVALLAGRLVVVKHQLRDVARFGFPTLERLAESGERVIEEAIDMIERFPEVALQA